MIYNESKLGGDIIKKILITIVGPYLYFDYKEDNTTADLLNTNIISEQELAFSETYIKNNKNIVMTFLDEIVTEKKISKIRIKDQKMGLIILELFTKNKDIKEIFIEDENPLTFDLYLKIIACKSIKKVNCYTIPKFILEQFDKNKIAVESRDEVFFTSHFMQLNNLINYSKIYYKTSIFIDKKLNNDDLHDLNTFCQINRYLKEVHIDFFDKDTINKVVSYVYKNNLKNVKILIHENITDMTLIEYLKRINKNYGKKYKVELKLVYSNEYISNNLFSQLIVNNIKMCCIIILSIFVAFFAVVLFNNYKDRKSVAKIESNLAKIVEKTKDNTSNVNKIPQDDEDARKVNELFNSLLEVNKETVGWLTVNNTSIDYPVVQANDNDYYLNNDFNHEKNYNGWVFADYRNNMEDLDQNTIIYGHNKYLNNTMFGSLNNVLENDWLNNSENLIIEFDNLYQEMHFKIFSVYKINKTNDYLTTSFSSKASFKKFLNIIKNRSIKKFDTDVTPEDKIITLSTCANKNKRIVIHAVLLDE